MADTVTMTDLKRRSRAVIDEVAAGASLTVTRRGRPVAVLVPVRPRGVPTADLLARWRHLPAVDVASFRADVSRAIDQSVFPDDLR